ncbi:uncharacterized protein [Musca autumnalis]|uniref:uncharacterized protein n=1 Tax=Musca autumnalis TaxID=221902 RepID=UPI003CF92DBA
MQMSTQNKNKQTKRIDRQLDLQATPALYRKLLVHIVVHNYSKKLLMCVVLAIFSASASAGVLPSVSSILPLKIEKHHDFAAGKEGFHFNLDAFDGRKREEVGMIMNPGSPEEELVYGEKVDDFTMDTDDKDGYMFKNRTLKASTLKSAAFNG